MASLRRSLRRSSPWLLSRVPATAPAARLLRHKSAASNPPASQHVDLDVGEIEGGVVKITPLQRKGEGITTKRSRLLCMRFSLFDFTSAHHSTLNSIPAANCFLRQTSPESVEFSSRTSYYPLSPRRASAP